MPAAQPALAQVDVPYDPAASALAAPVQFTRYAGNPILSPNPANWWERLVTTNPAAWWDEERQKVRMLYRCAGDDAWVAIAAFSEDEWHALRACMQQPAWSGEERFATLHARIKHQDDLDRLVEAWTVDKDRYDLMYQLQEAGVPAGAVQSHVDKFEIDPQLKVRDFFVHLDHSELGTWPFTRHLTPKLWKTPAHPGGITQRGAPCLGEDNEYVYTKLLGLSREEMSAFQAKGVI